ncbi:hypothetical protein BDY17DRAFT_319594 [Neohortaea acidophila]|uniref:MARVEL domain-containing protein n=1 Tax=Neohortaea acidophila TaxID=245834 RepID=A0A6A6Q410_9PEZI|nr:uncharacterized protein BDY17DRAFT_319594 [Neohortaea acidophila]KAF2487025.1 hypothetical protein BDY17DRAFT_319594 [Neohortaea acidophila]
MQGIKIGLLVTRIWLLICACVVLGTSAHLTSVTKAICDYINGDGGYCDESHLLAPLRYCIFTLAVWMHNIGGCRAGPICGELKADIAFLFLGLSGYIVAVVLVFVWQRRRQARD